MNTYGKDPEANLDYQFDWSAWLASGELISGAVVAITPLASEDETDCLTAAAPSVNTGVVTVWLSKGAAASRYLVTCNITTNQNRVDERSIIINCFDR